MNKNTRFDDLSQKVRDLNDKICFDDIREETRPNYEIIKALFSR